MDQLFADPPSGWMYGFPKPYDRVKNPDLKAWLVSEGYPQEDIDAHGNYFWCRFFTKNVEKNHEQTLDSCQK